MTAFPFPRVGRLVAIRFGTVAFATLVAAAPSASAQSNSAAPSWNPQEILRTERFVKPPENIERMIMTPRVDISFTNPSPDRTWFLRATGADRGDIKAFGKSHVWLGGLQVDTRANRARAVTTGTRTGLTLINPRTNVSKTLEVPKGATVTSPVWSPSGALVAYVANFDDASFVYVADVSSGKSTQLSKLALNATLVSTIAFTADGKQIIATLIPDGRGAAPTHGDGNIEDGPQVRLTESRALPQPFHFSLLQDPHDKALVAYYTTA
ncbi:MAG: hypothetical protein ABMA00_19595, partial [Gemmatimonas sp.]